MTTTETREVECPECKSSGIKHELDHDDECVSMTMYREIDCPKCYGRGYIILEREVKNDSTEKGKI